MKRLIITALLLSLASCLHAQITENRSIMVEGFSSGCKKHKDIQIIYEKFGNKKGEIIIDSYCKCRANFIVNNLTFKKVEQIYSGKEKMDNFLFQKMEYECTRQLDALIK